MGPPAPSRNRAAKWSRFESRLRVRRLGTEGLDSGPVLIHSPLSPRPQLAGLGEASQREMESLRNQASGAKIPRPRPFPSSC